MLAEAGFGDSFAAIRLILKEPCRPRRIEPVIACCSITHSSMEDILMKKLLSTAALVMALSGGIAIAQETSATTGGSDDAQNSIMDDKKIMGPFFTDDTLSTMKSSDELKQAYLALSAEDQKRMKDDCTRNAVPTWNDFCASIGAM
jgi:hypothetical protein